MTAINWRQVARNIGERAERYRNSARGRSDVYQVRDSTVAEILFSLSQALYEGLAAAKEEE